MKDLARKHLCSRLKSRVAEKASYRIVSLKRINLLYVAVVHMTVTNLIGAADKEGKR